MARDIFAMVVMDNLPHVWLLRSVWNLKIHNPFLGTCAMWGASPHAKYPLKTIPDWILSPNFLVSELQWNYNWNYICLHIHVLASGSQDIISQSDGSPPADTYLQQTKKRSHPMHTYQCPTDRKKTQQTKPIIHGSRPSSIAYQVIIRYG